MSAQVVKKKMVDVIVPKVSWNGNVRDHSCKTDPRNEKYIFSGKGCKINVLDYDDYVWFADEKRNNRYLLYLEKTSFPELALTENQLAVFEKIYAFANVVPK